MLIILTRHTMPQSEYITTEAALMILNCSRSYFHRKFIKDLTLYKDDKGYRNYFDKNEVKKLAKSKSKNIKIVRNAESTNIS